MLFKSRVKFNTFPPNRRACQIDKFGIGMIESFCYLIQFEKELDN